MVCGRVMSSYCHGYNETSKQYSIIIVLLNCKMAAGILTALEIILYLKCYLWPNDNSAMSI